MPKVTRACNEHMDCYTLHPTARDFSKSTCFAIQSIHCYTHRSTVPRRASGPSSRNNRIPNTNIAHEQCPSIIPGALHHSIPINPPQSSRAAAKTHVAALARRASDDVEATFHGNRSAQSNTVMSSCLADVSLTSPSS